MELYDSTLTCKCCGIVFDGVKGSTRKCIDHSENWIRGLICGNCNVGIGMLGDDLQGVINAARYLANNAVVKEEHVKRPSE